MERKPIATFKENVNGLFRKLKPFIDKYLVKDAFDWKRSYGRPTRSIKIELTFEQFDSKAIIFEDSWILCARPVIHTYWIDCDVDTYKATVKDEINEWLSVLKEKDVNNWLIVVIVNTDNRVKSKLLRNSTFDKVKSDFCGRHVDRCIMLCEPFKNDVKSMESWSGVGGRMRMLTVESYNKVMDRFEENMRMQRERRVEKDWNFCSYFLLQEELAFMYEMLGLYQDALIQYDELDALFTQFILNSSIAEPAPWLERMSNNIATRWDGVCLCRAIDLLKQNAITTNKCSLLDLRSYLFSRQSYLLMCMSQYNELIQRAIPFLLNFNKEVRLLQLSLPKGAVDCWIFLSCMEILKVCCLDNKMLKLDSDQSHSIALHATGLWDLAKSKMNNLGKICGLMVAGSAQPTSDDLMVVVDLLPGLVHTAGDSPHLNRLLESLSSKKAFAQYYLELLEQCICSLKHVGRLRCAKFVGKELADFYLLIEDYEKAEMYLIEALKTYKLEGWEMLANHTRLKVAKCQKKLNQLYKYCRTCMYILSSCSMNQDVRNKYLLELINISQEKNEKKDSTESSTEPAKHQQLQLKCSPCFIISVASSLSSSSSSSLLPRPPSSSSLPFISSSSSLLLSPPSETLEEAKVGVEVKYGVNILSNLPCEVTIDSIQVHFVRSSDGHPSPNKLKNVHSDPLTSIPLARSSSISPDVISLSRKASLDPSMTPSPSSTPQKVLPTHPLQPTRSRHSSKQSSKFRPRRMSTTSVLGGFELINRVAETVNRNFQPINLKEVVQYPDVVDVDEEDVDGNNGRNKMADSLSTSASSDSAARNMVDNNSSNRFNGPTYHGDPLFSALVCRLSHQRQGSICPKPTKDISSMFPSSQQQQQDCAIFTSSHPHDDVDHHAVVLKSGLNSIFVTGQFSKAGAYQAMYLIMKLNGKLEFVDCLVNFNSIINVHTQVIASQLTPTNTGKLSAGFKQRMKLSLPIISKAIHTNAEHATKLLNSLKILLPPGLHLVVDDDDDDDDDDASDSDGNDDDDHHHNSKALWTPLNDHKGSNYLKDVNNDKEVKNNNNIFEKMPSNKCSPSSLLTSHLQKSSSPSSSPPPLSSPPLSPPSSSPPPYYTLSSHGKEVCMKNHNGCVDVCLISNISPWLNNQSFLHKVLIMCDGYEDDVHHLNFKNPFNITHQVLTAVQRKYLQVLVECHIDEAIDVFNWRIVNSTDEHLNNSSTFTSLNAQLLNNKLTIHPHKNASLVWLISEEVIQTTAESTQSFSLSFDYNLTQQSPAYVGRSTSNTLTYPFKLDDIRTHYLTTVTMESRDVVFDHWTSIQLSIKRLISDNRLQDCHLHYVVTSNHSNTSCLLSGDVKGIIDFQEDKFELNLLCKPMHDHSMTIPKILLFQCHNQHKRRVNSGLQNEWKDMKADDEDNEVDDADDDISYKVSFDVDNNNSTGDDESTTTNSTHNLMNADTNGSNHHQKSLMSPINPCWVYDDSKIKSYSVNNFNMPQIITFDKLKPMLHLSDALTAL